eukprot:gene16255-9767_t
MKKRRGPPRIAVELQEAAEAAERAGGSYTNFVSIGGSLHAYRPPPRPCAGAAARLVRPRALRRSAARRREAEPRGERTRP